MINDLKSIIKKSAHIIVRSPLCDQVASITITSILGFIPLILMTLFLIYHSPLLNQYQHLIENFIFHALSTEQTANTLHHIQTQIPTIVNFQTSTLISLFCMAYFFLFTLAHTISKITKQNHRVPLHLKLFSFIFLIIFIVILTDMMWGNLLHAWWYSILLRTLFLHILFNIILPDHKHLSILSAVVTTLIAQLTFNALMVYYYSVFSDYHIIYGQLAGIAILLTWIYLSWFIIFFIIKLHKQDKNYD